MSRLAECAMSQAKYALKAHGMKTTKSRSCSIVAMIMSILLAVSFGAAGCAQEVVPAEGPQISMMEKTNVTSSGDPHNAPSTQYDAVPFTWNVVQNTLGSSRIAVLHVNDVDIGEACCSGVPVRPFLLFNNGVTGTGCHA